MNKDTIKREILKLENKKIKGVYYHYKLEALYLLLIRS